MDPNLRATNVLCNEELKELWTIKSFSIILKGIVHWKMNILSLLTHPSVIPAPFFPVEYKIKYLSLYEGFY